MAKKYTPGKYKVRVGKSKTGKGLFALENIPKGACIIEYIGRAIPFEEQESAKGRYLFTTGKKTMVDGNIKENTAKYINHSCRPNCEATGPEGHVYIMAIKNIKAGDELNYNYGDEYFDDYIKPVGCKCIKCLEKAGKN
jgi:uncharacterized protein